MKKGQTGRLTTQHIKSGGAVGIFGKSAQVHDTTVGSVSKEVFTELKKKYPKYEFNFKKGISKQEINRKLRSIDSRLGQTLFVKESRIKPDGGIIEVIDKKGTPRIILVSEAKYQGKDIENIQGGILVGKNKDQDLMVAGNAIERAYKNINEIRNYMLDELHFPYVIFLQGSNFATKIVQVFKPDGTFIEIKPDAGGMNRIDRVTAANYSMPINNNYCKNIFISNKKASVMLQAASLYARCEAWTEKEMKIIMLEVAETSLDILNQLG